MSDTWDEAVAAYWAAETRADLFAATARMRALGVVCPYCEAIKAPTDKTQCQCEGAKDAEIARLRAEVAALREQMAAAAKCSEIVREAMSFLLLPSEKAALRQCCPGFPASPEGRCTCDEAGAGWEARG